MSSFLQFLFKKIFDFIEEALFLRTDIVLADFAEAAQCFLLLFVQLSRHNYLNANQLIAALTAALPYNDCLGVNTYKCQFLRAAEGENDINHNGTGDKGSSRWFLKGVGESCVREGVPTTDWDWIIYTEGL